MGINEEGDEIKNKRKKEEERNRHKFKRATLEPLQ